MDRVSSFITNLKRDWWRAAFRKHCSKVGKDLLVQGPVAAFGGGRLEVGDHLVIRSTPHLPVEIYTAPGAALQLGCHVFLNQGVRISCSQRIVLGDYCLLGDECVLLDNDFHADPGKPIKMAPIVLEEGVWLATRVIVLRGVTIGRGSRVGAGSVVTHSIPPNSFAAGSPARVIHSLE